MFEDVRGSVERLSVVGRVYARIHWDKALNNWSISGDVSKDGNIMLERGTVPDRRPRRKPTPLPEEHRVGVQTVVNELTNSTSRQMAYDSVTEKESRKPGRGWDLH